MAMSSDEALEALESASHDQAIAGLKEPRSISRLQHIAERGIQDEQDRLFAQGVCCVMLAMIITDRL